jgi:hypothetical protein
MRPLFPKQQTSLGAVATRLVPQAEIDVFFAGL